MNKNKNTLPKKELKVTITEKGLKVSKPIPLSVLINHVIRGLLAVCLQQPDKDAMYDMLATAFGNTLAYISPEKYYGSEEELRQQLADEDKAMAALAADTPEVDVKAMKEKVAERIEGGYAEGETVTEEDLYTCEGDEADGTSV